MTDHTGATPEDDDDPTETQPPAAEPGLASETATRLERQDTPAGGGSREAEPESQSEPESPSGTESGPQAESEPQAHSEPQAESEPDAEQFPVFTPEELVAAKADLEQMTEDYDTSPVGAPGRVVSRYREGLRELETCQLIEEIQSEWAGDAQTKARLAQLYVELISRSEMQAREFTPDEGNSFLGSKHPTKTLSRADLAAAELAAAAALSAYQAQIEVATAIALDERCFQTMELLQAGELDYMRAQLITRHATSLGDYTFAEARRQKLSPRQAEDAARAIVKELEDRVVRFAGKDSRRQLGNRLLREAARLSPDYAEQRRKGAVAARSVTKYDNAGKDPDGQDLVTINALLPAPEAHGVWNTIDSSARVLRERGDQRTLEQLRADVFTHLVLRGHPPVAALTSAGTGTEGGGEGAPIDWAKIAGFDKYGLRANIQVIVPLETLTGVSDEPGELVGHGVITAQAVRELAFEAGGTWRRLVTDDLGQLKDYGTTQHDPGTRLAAFVKTRDQDCRTPYCDRLARWCHLDHVREYPDGSTCEQNLECKCPRCHRMKHEGFWKHTVLDPATAKDLGYAPGTIKIVTPAGQEYYTEPAILGPVRGQPRAATATAGTETVVNGSPYGLPPF